MKTVKLISALLALIVALAILAGCTATVTVSDDTTAQDAPAAETTAADTTADEPEESETEPATEAILCKTVYNPALDPEDEEIPRIENPFGNDDKHVYGVIEIVDAKTNQSCIAFSLAYPSEMFEDTYGSDDLVRDVYENDRYYVVEIIAGYAGETYTFSYDKMNGELATLDGGEYTACGDYLVNMPHPFAVPFSAEVKVYTPGGENVRTLIEDSWFAKCDISEDGTVYAAYIPASETNGINGGEEYTWHVKTFNVNDGTSEAKDDIVGTAEAVAKSDAVA